MKNVFTVHGDIVRMMVKDQCIVFDTDDLHRVSEFASWRLVRKRTIYAQYQDADKTVRVTLQKFISGSLYVKWINGNCFDFRKENLIHSDKNTQFHSFRNGLECNPCRFEEDRIVLEFKRRKSSIVHEIYIDHEDYPIISGFKWNVANNGYVQTKGKINTPFFKKRISLHRLIMNITELEQVIDHINGNKLDCRKCNLRVSSQSQNCHNSPRMRSGEDVGVAKYHYEAWIAQIGNNSKMISKTFKTYDEALQQRIKWEKEFGHNNDSRKPNPKNGDSLGVIKVVLDKWRARIQINNVGRSKKFKTREEAIAQRKAWEFELNPSGLNK